MHPSRYQLSTLRFALLTTAGFIAFVSAWYAAALSGFTPPQFLPMPHQVIIRLVRLIWVSFAGATLGEHLAASFARFAFGFGLAALIGVPLGLIMGMFRWVDEIVSPVFDGLRFVPPIAWVPFAALWMGTGMGGPILIIFAGAALASIAAPLAGFGMIFGALLLYLRPDAPGRWHPLKIRKLV